MTDTEDYIVFDRTGTPHVVVAVKTESGNREVEGRQFDRRQEDIIKCPQH